MNRLSWFVFLFAFIGAVFSYHGSCPEPFEMVAGHCYHAVTKLALTFDEASAFCTYLVHNEMRPKPHLLRLENRQEIDEIAKWMKKKGDCGDYGEGITLNGTVEADEGGSVPFWIDIKIDITHLQWNNAFARQIILQQIAKNETEEFEAVAMECASNFEWKSFDAEKNHRFVCETEPPPARRYYG